MRQTVVNLGITLLAGCAAVSAFLWWHVANSPEQLAREALAERSRLEQVIANEQAELIRQRAECQAAAHEHGPDHAAACWRLYAVQADIAGRTIEKATRALATLEQ